MRCPFCAHEDSQVKDSRPTEDGAAIRRRRQCEACGARFTTFERVQLRDLTVVKKDGKREPFDRDKLARAIGHRLPQARHRRRPRSTGWSAAIQRQLETCGDEVDASEIGEVVMDGLKALDHVAYIRFASVYKDFSEPGDFAEIAERVEEEAPRRPDARQAAVSGATKPVIVLVRPQLGQNIGKAARAMLNFGLTEMRLVAPARRLAQPDAGPAASGADIVLEQAQVFATVAEAIADCRPSSRRPSAGATWSCRWSARRRWPTQIAAAPDAQRDPVRARALGPRNRGGRARQRDRHRADQPRVRHRSTWPRR